MKKIDIKIGGSTQDFANEIEEIMNTHSITLMDALMHLAETKGVEIETIAAMVRKNHTLKAKLFKECEVLKLVVKENE